MSFFCPAAPSEASEHFNQDRQVRAEFFCDWRGTRRRVPKKIGADSAAPSIFGGD
jgi:hypothetical protein